MISKNKIKFLNSLKLKKNRDINNLFVVEGTKNFFELKNQNKYKIVDTYCTNTWLEKNNISLSTENIISENELKKISSQKTPEGIFATVKKNNSNYSDTDILNNYSIVLDEIQDPGNLGTIIRTADWFGISNIFCSQNSVDVYNPKVIQATKGAIFRVNVFYIDVINFLNKYSKKTKIYTAHLDGENIYETNFDNNGIIIFGNEGNGISDEILKLNVNKIKIPNFSKKNKKTESLNISISTAIFLSEISRKTQIIK